MSDRPKTTWYPLAPPPASRPHRRLFLQSAVAGSAIVATIGGAGALPDHLSELATYQRTFFTDAEWAFVLAACARLIPSEGDGPGAVETRVPIFLDKQMSGDFGRGADWYMEGPHVPDADPRLGFQSPLTPAHIYRGGIAHVDAWCKREHGTSFADLDAAKQDEVLTLVETSKVGIAPELRDFFRLLLQNTKEGYFADPQYGGNHKMASWVYIGFPGARASFREWVEKDNVRYPLGPVSISGRRA